MKPDAAVGPVSQAPRRAALRGLGAAGLAGLKGLSTLAALGTLGSVGGCGFRLRGATSLGFSRLHLTGAAPQSSMAQELRRQLGGRVQLVEAAQQAQVVLRLESAQREKVVTGLTATGLVRELVLRLRVRFSLGTPQGGNLIDPTDLILQRDMATNESAALAKAREEEEIFRVLERDVALQIVRRLEAVSLPKAPA
jgi:LPS-assembly lipoprotein